MHGEQNSMESNIPVVGGEEPKQDVSQHTEPYAEGPANGTTSATLSASSHDESAPEEITSDTGAHSDILPEVEHQPEVEPGIASDDSMQTLLDQHTDEPQVKKGDILEGTVAQTTPTEILVDIGLKSEGIIAGKELERMDRETLDRLKVGEKILAYVLNPEDKNGNVVLSLSRAVEEQDW